MKRTIMVDGMGCLREAIISETGTAANVDVLPGMFLERARKTTGGKDYDGVRRLRANAIGDRTQTIVAIEEDIAPNQSLKDDTESIDTPWKAGGANDADVAKAEPIRFVYPRPGERVLARVAAGADAIEYDDPLEVDTSAASKYGTLKKANAAADKIKAVACEDVDNSAGTETALILVEIV